MSHADFSDCGNYRYTLWRGPGPDEPYVCIVGLNPSTADTQKNDPTIRRCIGFAEEWGYENLCVMNLFAWRATYPRDLKNAADPVGPENAAYSVLRPGGIMVPLKGRVRNFAKASAHCIAWAFRKSANRAILYI